MRTVGELVQRNAERFPDREAHVCGERRLTHGQFAERALRLADGLFRLGLRRQDRFAILAMNGLEYYESYAAAEVAGFILVPVNFRLASPEILHLFRDAQPKALLFEAQYANAVSQLREQYPEIKHYICIGSEAPEWALGFEEVVNRGSPSGPPIKPRAEDYVYLWYTSGTTGRPKGVPWQQVKALASARSAASTTEMTGDTRVLQVTPVFHIGGKGYALGAAWAGGCVVLHRGFDAGAMLETIERERITMTFMVAAMLQAVLDVPEVGARNLSSIRQIVTAAAPVPVPLLKRGIETLGRVFSIQYGCTEAGTIAAMPRFEVNPYGNADDVRRLGSVGHVVPEVDFRVVDEQGNDCPIGVPGEVIIRSEMVLDEYWNNSVATLESLRDGWYHTGDIGVLDEQRYLFLVDRKKDMIITGGENVYSREVEEALLSHPGVVDAAVIGVPHPKWVETVKAVVVAKEGAPLTEAALLAHCKALIAGYKCPKSVDFVTELPRLATGKLDKVTLRSRYR